jgi:hypothetical protein
MNVTTCNRFGITKSLLAMAAKLQKGFFEKKTSLNSARIFLSLTNWDGRVRAHETFHGKDLTRTT